jgi:hypothetical protein
MRYNSLNRMSTSIPLLALTLGGLSASPSVTSVTPIFGQLIAISVPDGFSGAFQNTRNGFYIQESVPAGETVDHWSQMITLTGRQAAANNPQASPRALVLNIFGGFQRACPATFAIVEMGPRKVDGYEAFAAIGSCGSVPANTGAHSETALILGIKGAEDFYTVQWAERGPRSDVPLTLDSKEWSERFKRLEPIRVCVRIIGELPPYLSCLKRSEP